MSTSIDIFVDTPHSLEDFVLELERLVQLSFQREIDSVDHQAIYKFDDERASIWVYEHEFDNDRGFLFEEYPYFIDIEAKRSTNWEETEAWQRKLGYQVFEALKKAGEYRLLMVWDLQEFLEKFEPREADSATDST